MLGPQGSPQIRVVLSEDPQASHVAVLTAKIPCSKRTQSTGGKGIRHVGRSLAATRAESPPRCVTQDLQQDVSTRVRCRPPGTLARDPVSAQGFAESGHVSSLRLARTKLPTPRRKSRCRAEATVFAQTAEAPGASPVDQELLGTLLKSSFPNASQG